MMIAALVLYRDEFIGVFTATWRTLIETNKSLVLKALKLILPPKTLG
jgi:hypothetical protein